MFGRLRLPRLSKPEGFAKVTTAASVFRTDVRNREAGVVGFEPRPDVLVALRAPGLIQIPSMPVRNWFAVLTRFLYGRGGI
jgi:hypothetical protein